MRIRIVRHTSEAEYDIQLNQSCYQVAGNNNYRITFRGRADGDREVCLGFSKAAEPWSNLGLYRKLLFTPEWDDYSAEFVATADDENGRIHFDLGGAGVSVELCSVRMWRITDSGLVALSPTEPARPKDLRTATTRDMLAWRDRIVMEAAAHMERREIAQAEAWLRRLEQTTTDAWTLEMTDPYLVPIARGRKVVASFDPSRQPAADEVVIVYGNYPHMYGNVVVNNPIRRHVADFWNFRHDEVESDHRWAGVDQIFIINVEERLDRYDSILRELASARAPFDRVTRVPAVKPVPGDTTALGGPIACLRSHIATLRRAQAAQYEHVLVLEDDFCFTSDLEQHLTDLAAFFERGYSYWICLLATSKHGVIAPMDDLVSASFQPVTGTAGHLVSREGVERLLPVFESAIERLQATGDCTRYTADRCWAVLQPSGKFLVFRRKFGFQVANFSDIERTISRYLD